MAGDSAFRHLLLDTVATTISQPPSITSLIELLRIATPSLLPSSGDVEQRELAEARVRDASQRERLFRTLQLRIHPDKHDGDEKATTLFQETASFYEKCVEAMKMDDDRRRRLPDRAREATRNDDSNGSQGTKGGGAKASSGGDNDSGDGTSGAPHSQFPRRHPWYQHNRHEQDKNDPRQPRTGGSTHSDYENCDHEQQWEDPWRNKNNPRGGGRRPPSHLAFAVVGTVLFPPLGLCALFHSFRARRAWDEGLHREARGHSDRAYSFAWYGCLCFLCLFLYLWLSDGRDDFDWDWDRMKDSFPWHDGP